MNKGLHESVCQSIRRKRLNEKAETNIKKIDFIELNEFLAGLKEHIEYDINPDLEYFRVILSVDDSKAYIDIEPKDLDDINFFDGWSVEDIIDSNYQDGYDFTEKQWDDTKDRILKEKDYIEGKIIPKLAREWGFRNIKKLNNSMVNEAAESDDDWDLDRIDVLWEKGRESIIEDVWGYGISDGWTVNRFFITEEGKPLFDYQPSKQARAAVDKLIKSGELVHKVHESCNEEVEADDEREIPSVLDMVEVNLFNEGSMSGNPWYMLKEHPETKYIGERDRILNSKYYSIPSQVVFDNDGEYSIIHINLLDKEDADNAISVVNKLGLDGKFNSFLGRRRKDPRYNYLYTIYIPNRVTDMNAAEYLRDKNISPDLFRKPNRVANHIRRGK